jgi:large subunit ribosomal protein L1
MSLQMNDLEKTLKEVLASSETKKKRKFVETIDVVVNLKNVNLKDPNKRFNNEIELPNTVDEKTTVCFFVDGDQLVQAGNLKADAMGKEAMDSMGKKEKAEKRKFVNKYEYFVANTEMMKLVAKYFGKLFGPKGKMPRPQPQGFGVINPGDSIAPTLEKYKRVIRMKLQKFPLIQFKIGSKAMEIKKLAQNLKTSIEWIDGKLEKGRANIRSVYVKTTMGASVKLL